MGEWRVGRKLGRTLYRDEQFVGLVDTAEIASEIVEAMNGRLRALAPAGCGCPVTLSSTRTTTHTRECSDRQAAERLAATIEDDDLGKSDEDDADDHPVDCGCAMCLQERDELFT